MDEAEYFSQDEYYFSESEGQLLRIEEMPIPHLKHAMLKLWKSESLFSGSVLHQAMVKRLRPEPLEVASLLRQYGTVSYWVGDDFPGMWPSIRSMAYRVGKNIGKKVATHKNGDFLEISIVVPVRVKTH